MNRQGSERGVSLIETMIAVFIALIGVFGLGGVIFQATVLSKNQGAENTRAVIYAQDKIESLLALDFKDCNKSASSQPAACNTTGITASGWTQGLLGGGGTEPLVAACPASGPSVGYVDFLDLRGLRLSGSSCSALAAEDIAYVRQWRIQDLPSSGPALKQITVAVYSLSAVTALGPRPVAVVTSTVSDAN